MNTRIFHDCIERLGHAPMAMRPDAMQSLLAKLAIVEAEAPELTATEVRAIPAADEAKVPRIPKVKGGVALIPVYGTVGQHRGGDYWADVYSDELVAKISQAADMPNIGATVLSFDGPGGIVYGVPEASQAIRELGQRKPIYGHVRGQAASATYWLASATSRLFAQPSAKVGSIGVWTMHIDASKAIEEMGWNVTLISAGKYKVEANPFAPLEEEARGSLQASVDRYYEMFTAGVAEGRGVSVGTVKGDFGEGRMVDAETAKTAGMIDGIATLDELLAGMMEPSTMSRRSRAQAIRIEEARSFS